MRSHFTHAQSLSQRCIISWSHMGREIHLDTELEYKLMNILEKLQQDVCLSLVIYLLDNFVFHIEPTGA